MCDSERQKMQILEFEIFDTPLQRNFTAWQGVQTSLGVSFWKYCLNLEKTFHRMIFYTFFAHQIDVDISDFQHISHTDAKSMSNVCEMRQNYSNLMRKNENSRFTFFKLAGNRKFCCCFRVFSSLGHLQTSFF